MLASLRKERGLDPPDVGLNLGTTMAEQVHEMHKWWCAHKGKGRICEQLKAQAAEAEKLEASKAEELDAREADELAEAKHDEL